MAGTIQNLFQQQDIDTDEYRWREGRKRIKFIFFSNFKPCTDLPGTFNKWLKDDENNDKRDVDLLYLQNEFVNKYIPFEDAEMCIHQNIRTAKLADILGSMKTDTGLDKFDCYFFVFLTFLSTEGVNNDAGLLHFHDGRVTLDKIWDEVSEIPAMTNKPKVFLVQADDVKMLQKPPMFTKAPFSVIQKKIPTDSDRLTILSTLPSRAFGEKNQPSFLIQAFVEEMKENWNSSCPLDVLSLTIPINLRVLKMIKKCNATDDDKNNLPVPCTTSTLKQLLYM